MISIALWFLASILNGAMDMNFNMFDRSVFSTFKNQDFWNPALSWVNKWEDGDRSKGEDFFGSSTFLVWLTDSWHIFKLLFLMTMVAGIICYKSILPVYYSIPLYALVWFVGFEGTIRLLKRKV